jgi:uncharacterized protein
MALLFANRKELEMTLTVTPLFVAALAIFQVVITNFVGYYRLKSDIHFLDGGDPVLTRRMRAHANFTETVPITLIAMLTAEFLAAPHTVLWTGGMLLIAGRLWHYFYIVRTGWGTPRALSMVLTFAAMITFSLAILWQLYAV